VAELLGAVARPCGLVVVIEDAHWADGATLDCLTYLARTGGAGALTVVVTCRSDEAPLDAQVAGWLADMRGGGGVEEIRLGPLSRGEVAEQIARLVGGEPPGWLSTICTPAPRVTRFHRAAGRRSAGRGGGGRAAPAGRAAGPAGGAAGGACGRL
jgi:hypothetical protein